jgi:hypothetical protein
MQNPYEATDYENELAQFWQQPWQQRWVPPTNDGEFCDVDTPSSYSSGDVTPCQIAPFGGGCQIAPFGGCYQDLHLYLQHEGEGEEPSEDEETNDEETNNEETNDEEPNGDEGEMEIPDCTDVPNVPETRHQVSAKSVSAKSVSAKSVGAKKTKPKRKSKSAAIVPKPKFIPFQITINVNHENDPAVVLLVGKKDTDLPSKHHASREAKKKWTHNTNRARGTRIVALE